MSASTSDLKGRMAAYLVSVVTFTIGPSPASAATISDVGSWSSSGQDVTFNIVDGSRLRVTVLAADLIRVRFAPGGVFVANISRAVVKDDWPATSFTTGEDASKVTISTAELNIEVQKTPCVVVCRDSSNNLIVTDDPARRIQWGSGYTRVYKTTQPGEDYLGLGWRPSGGLRRNGTRFVMKNWPTYSDPTLFYGGIPIWHGLRSGKDYAIFFDDTSWGEINVGQESSSYMSFENLGGQVDYYFFYGPAMSKVLDRYTELTGRPFLPPKWACGYQQSRWSYTPQAEVLSIANEFRTRQIPCDVIYLDVDYMDPGKQLTFNPSTFPDPAGMCATLHAQGFRTIANIEPWEMEGTARWNYGDSHGYFLKDNGSSYTGWYDYAFFVMGAPTGWGSWVDYTSPAARTWYEGEHTAFLNYGIDGIWNDKNEPDELGNGWPDSITYDVEGSPTSHDKTSTQYCLFQMDFSYNVLKNHYPTKRPFTLSRGAYAGIQRSSAVWSGDNISIWDHAQLNIPMGLSMSISGQPHNGHDIGGFFNDPPGSENPISGELYARWMQWGVFSAFCRQHHYGYGNHGNCPYVEPWEFGATVENICREFIELRYRLMPYLYSVFYEAHTTGAPIHRPTVYDFQNDPATVTQDHDFMFGPFMLISPVYTEGVTTRSVYLPASATWIDWWDDTVRSGGATYAVSAPFERLPIHVRQGAIVPMGPVMQYGDELPVTELTLRMYPSGEQTIFTLFEDDGISWAYQSGSYAQTTYTAIVVDEELTLDIAARVGSYVPTARTYLLQIRTWSHDDSVVQLDGSPLTQYATKPEFDAAPSGYYYDPVADIMYARFADSGDHMVVTVGPAAPVLVRPEEGTLIFQDGREYPDQTTYAGTCDAHIIQNRSLYNAGGHEVLEAARDDGGDATHDRSVVIKFTELDTSWEAGKVLQQASLTLEYFDSRNDPGGVAKMLYIHKLLHDWGEGAKTGIDGEWAGANEVCWTKPYGATNGDNPNWNGTLGEAYADPVALDSATLSSGAYGAVSFDVTPAVQEHLANPSLNFGFVIREEEGSESTEDGTRQFHSREAATILLRPSLTLTFVDQPPPVNIESVQTMADHGAAGELGLNVNLTASTLPADSALITTESREEGITKLLIDCDGDVTLPDPPENLVESILGVNNGDVTADVLSVTAVADVITINLSALPDQDTYTVTLLGSVIAGDNDFMIRALEGEVDNGGASSQVVNALDLSAVRIKFTADVTVGDNAKYDIVSDGAINALDLSECRIMFTRTAP